MIDCHGAQADLNFYGQAGTAYPIAVASARIAPNVTAGTVIAAECCFGAELYNHTLIGIDEPICMTHLRHGACAFVGSTNIAYGPPSGNGQADLLTQDRRGGDPARRQGRCVGRDARSTAGTAAGAGHRARPSDAPRYGWRHDVSAGPEGGGSATAGDGDYVPRRADPPSFGDTSLDPLVGTRSRRMGTAVGQTLIVRDWVTLSKPLLG